LTIGTSPHRLGAYAQWVRMNDSFTSVQRKCRIETSILSFSPPNSRSGHNVVAPPRSITADDVPILRFGRVPTPRISIPSGWCYTIKNTIATRSLLSSIPRSPVISTSLGVVLSCHNGLYSPESGCCLYLTGDCIKRPPSCPCSQLPFMVKTNVR